MFAHACEKKKRDHSSLFKHHPSSHHRLASCEGEQRSGWVLLPLFSLLSTRIARYEDIWSFQSERPIIFAIAACLRRTSRLSACSSPLSTSLSNVPTAPSTLFSLPPCSSAPSPPSASSALHNTDLESLDRHFPHQALPPKTFHIYETLLSLDCLDTAGGRWSNGILIV